MRRERSNERNTDASILFNVTRLDCWTSGTFKVANRSGKRRDEIDRIGRGLTADANWLAEKFWTQPGFEFLY